MAPRSPLDGWRLPSAILLGIALAALPACSPLKPHGKSPLSPVQMNPQSVALDIFFIRCPAGDPRLNDRLWTEVDEQVFSNDSRYQWNQNGFRLGVVMGQIPVVLSQLLELSDKGEAEATDTPGRVDLQQDPRVVQRHLELRPGQRGEVVASGVYDEWPVLMCEAGEVSGHTYQQAQGQFALRVANENDGRVRLELTPEMTYGDIRQRWVGGQGMLRLEAGRPKRSFDSMATAATLARGQILVVSSLPQRPGSLGSHFFSDQRDGKPEQKLLVIRLAQAQHNDLLAPAEVLPLDVSPDEK